MSNFVPNVAVYGFAVIFTKFILSFSVASGRFLFEWKDYSSAQF